MNPIATVVLQLLSTFCVAFLGPQVIALLVRSAIHDKNYMMNYIDFFLALSILVLVVLGIPHAQ